MRVWSIRNIEEMEVLSRDGILRTDPDRVEPYMQPAYRWMARQLAAKSPASGVEFPIWVWARAEARGARPDLRRGGHLLRGEAGILVELEVEPARLLLSDFEMWHAVLNGHYLERDEADGVTHESGQMTPESRQQAMEASWTGIFDIERKTHSHVSYGPPETAIIQGVMWELRKEDVRSTQKFRAR